MFSSHQRTSAHINSYFVFLQSKFCNLSIYLSIHPSVYESINQSIYVSTYLPTYLPTYLSIHSSIHLLIRPSIYLWLYSPLLDLGRVPVSWSFTGSVGLLEQVIRLSQGRYLHTGQHKHRINAHIHSCLKWVSNPPSQCPSGRRQFLS
jgi:hypothetical protein